MVQVENNKAIAINMLGAILRPGMKDLIEYLTCADYFTAPASTRFHGAYEGGLVEHSLNVTEMFAACNKDMGYVVRGESVIICGLLHDLCKIKYYTREGLKYRSVKTHPANTSHAKLSIEIIEKFIKLLPEERDIILYHMGLFGCYGKTVEYTPLEMYSAIMKNPAVQIFAACDMEESRRK